MKKNRYLLKPVTTGDPLPLSAVCTPRKSKCSVIPIFTLVAIYSMLTLPLDAQPNSHPTPNVDDELILESLRLDFLSASPSSLVPFQPPSSVIRWRIRPAQTAPAAPIQYFLNGTPVQSEGVQTVQPGSDTLYRLVAKLHLATRELGTVLVRFDTSGCSTRTLYEDALKGLIELGFTRLAPPAIYNVSADADIQQGQAQIHITAKYAFAVTIGDVNVTEWPDPTVRVDIALTLGAQNGRLTFPAENISVDIDSDWLLDTAVFFADPNFKRNIEADVSLKVAHAIEDFFQGSISGGSRVWSVTTTGVPGPGAFDRIEILSCPYPTPWIVNVTFSEVKLADSLNDNRVAQARFFFDVNGHRAEYPLRLPINIPIDASGESQSLALPQAVSQSIGEVRTGIDDWLNIAVGLSDRSKNVPTLSDSSGRPRIVPPAGVTNRYDWSSLFGKGNHTNVSSSFFGESFELKYRIDVRWDCPTCAANPTPTQ